MNYKHNFPKSGHELTADITYNAGTRTGNSITKNYFDYFNNSGSTEDPDSTIVKNYSENDNSQLTFQVDYSNPVTENSKIEMGLRSYFNDQKFLLDVFSVDGNVVSKLPLSNNYRFDEEFMQPTLHIRVNWEKLVTRPVSAVSIQNLQGN